MTEQVISLLSGLIDPQADPRRYFQAVPSVALEELTELAFQVAFWGSYERNKRGESTEVVGWIDKDALWHAVTRLPLPREADRGAEDLGWLLEPGEELRVNLRDGGSLESRLDSVTLGRLHDQLAESLTIVRRELRLRGLSKPVAKLVSIPSD